MDNREKFIEALKSTGRNGIDAVLAGLEKLGFFIAPASTRFHGAEKGGLLAHSLNVYEQAMALREMEIKLKPQLEEKLPVMSVVIASLLHDVCKAEVYKEVEKFRKDQEGKWEKYTTYGVDYSAFPMGHGEKSVVRLLRWGLEMTEDEMLAIRWHMSAFDMPDSPEARGNFTAAGDKSPLITLISCADTLAAHLTETRG